MTKSYIIAKTIFASLTVLVAEAAFLDIVQRAQDEHGCLVVGGAQRGDDRQPVDPRQHAVDDHGIEGLAPRYVQSGPPVLGQIDAMAALGQSLDEIGSGLLVVLDDQNTHDIDRSSSGEAGSCRALPCSH